MKLECFRQIFSKNPQISKFMKNRPMGAGFFRMDGRTDGETVAFFSFGKASKTLLSMTLMAVMQGVNILFSDALTY
jgi:hypothetical protein